MIGASALLAFSIGNVMFGSVVAARTMTFCVLSLSQLFHAFNMRSERSVLNRGFFKNKALVFSLVLGSILQFSVVSILPLSKIFKVCALNGAQWAITALLSVMPIVIVELQKAFTKKAGKY